MLSMLQKVASAVALNICVLLCVDLFCFIHSTKTMRGMMTTTLCHFESFVVWAFLWLRERRASLRGVEAAGLSVGQARERCDRLVTPLRGRAWPLSPLSYLGRGGSGWMLRALRRARTGCPHMLSRRETAA